MILDVLYGQQTANKNLIFEYEGIEPFRSKCDGLRYAFPFVVSLMVSSVLDRRCTWRSTLASTDLHWQEQGRSSRRARNLLDGVVHKPFIFIVIFVFRVKGFTVKSLYKHSKTWCWGKV